MVSTVRVLLLLVSMAVVVAAPAGADQGDYLRMLLPKYAYLSSQQLLAEAGKVCHIVRSGRSSSEAVPVVREDLAVSTSTALDIVADARVYLGC